MGKLTTIQLPLCTVFVSNAQISLETEKNIGLDLFVICIAVEGVYKLPERNLELFI